MLALMDADILFDPTHFHRNIIPRLLEAGVTQQQIDTMLVDNPRRFFSGQGTPVR
jgi:phosphotriesterase-related protein